MGHKLQHWQICVCGEHYVNCACSFYQTLTLNMTNLFSVRSHYEIYSVYLLIEICSLLTQNVQRDEGKTFQDRNCSRQYDDEALSNEALKSRTPGFVWEMKSATANAADPTAAVSAAEGTLCE